MVIPEVVCYCYKSRYAMYLGIPTSKSFRAQVVVYPKLPPLFQIHPGCKMALTGVYTCLDSALVALS